MRANILPLVVVCTAAVLGPPLIDPSKARELFRLGSSSGSLTLTEIEVIFRAFDANGKCHFTYLTV
ncbi:hypothetical protein C0Q70_17730 [Pomacea canaliculata]|uniref:EF-hand domain-containing protein n=1 Tax=Pomacea canaliculata TaxID=400727 RepID=A0A2T7NL74_POMCA|nr:hypothetical protein C0Q70_17730 [Pomacea canaliculata]